MNREYLDLVQRASDILFKIPGVLSVGLGNKIISGQNTGQLALSVMVEEKKPREALRPEETVPEELEGVPTDVVEGAPPKLIEEEVPDEFDPGVPKDLTKYRPIVGGIRIRGARSADVERRQSFGTLGCFATTTGKDAGKHVLLTNYHVLEDPIGELHGPSCTGCTKGDGVGNPNTGDQIATVLRGKNNDQLDAAIAVLDSGVQFQREVIKDDDPAGREVIRGTRVLTQADLNIEVHKRGHRTRITYGQVGGVGVQAPLIDGKRKENQIRIDLPLKVQAGTTVTFQADGTISVPAVDFIAEGVEVNDIAWVQGSLNNGRFRIAERRQHEIVVAGNLIAGIASLGFFVTPPNFALKGDSGSVLLDANGMVVGLVWAASESRVGNAWANPIDAVERELRIKIDSATAIGDTQIALLVDTDPQTDAAVEPGRLRPAAIVTGGVATPPVNLRERVEDDLMGLSRGRQIYDLYFTHHLEVRELLDSNDQIARIWHRQGGPAIIQSVLDAVRSRQTAIPATIRGKSWAERVKAILSVFAEHGSTRLRDDITRFGDQIAGFPGFTYPELLESLGK